MAMLMASLLCIQEMFSKQHSVGIPTSALPISQSGSTMSLVQNAPVVLSLFPCVMVSRRVPHAPVPVLNMYEYCASFPALVPVLMTNTTCSKQSSFKRHSGVTKVEGNGGGGTWYGRGRAELPERYRRQGCSLTSDGNSVSLIYS